MNSESPTQRSASRRYASAAALLFLTLVGMSTTGTAFAQTQAPDARLTRVANLAGQHKPAGVPQDYVQTPFGYFAPACVRHIGASDRILADGTLQKANGIQEQSARCSQDNFTSNGVRVRPNGLGLDGQEVRRGASSAAFKKRSPVPAAIDHAYISSAGYYSGVSPGRIVANWKVPPNPTNVARQTIYFFPALQSDTPVILQPVLGYRGESNSWDLSSWNCCKEGVVWYSDFIPAKSGDQINGDVYATCAAGSVCSSWNIDTRNVTSGRSVRLSTTSYGDLTQIMAGALEVYSVDSCDEYPASGNITFTGVAVYDYRMKQVRSPPWEEIIDNSGLDLQCNYQLDTTSTTATIHY
ncbi:hypothetical protein TN51_19550 [Xanthomonas euvesicatoria pv. citrumelonis]|nr:hypothetical protein [Xanthomonas euvesicatoria]TKA14067.1 hypothetical protein TN51_19550 [Xanthomonas euvesicatoria pv. citrumelonis]